MLTFIYKDRGPTGHLNERKSDFILISSGSIFIIKCVRWQTLAQKFAKFWVFKLFS